MSASPDTIAEQLAAGAVVVDLRSPRVFETGHPAGAVSVVYDPQHLAERVANAAAPGTPLVLFSDEPGQTEDAVRQLKGDFPAIAAGASPTTWQAAGLEWVKLATIGSETFVDEALRAKYHVIDVREPMEWETGHVPGAQLIALGEIRQRVADVPEGLPIAVICESGTRSATAASILAAAGRTPVYNVLDGTSGYRKAGHPLSFPEEGS